MTQLLKTEITGDLWRGCVGTGGSLLAVISSSHEEFDAIVRTAGVVVGLLVGIASLISLCQRIWDNHKKSKWEGIIFKSDKDEN